MYVGTLLMVYMWLMVKHLQSDIKCLNVHNFVCVCVNDQTGYLFCNDSIVYVSWSSTPQWEVSCYFES